MSTVSRDNLKDILDRIKGKRVLVLGDLMLDHYVETRVKRLSREHLIPVHKIIKERYFAGGAANLAVNIASLGGKAYLVGVVGNDNEGHILRDILIRNGIDVRLATAERPTPLKSRYHTAGTIYFRVDREVTDDLDTSITHRLISMIEDILNNNIIDCICVSDYDKGSVTPLLLNSVVESARNKGIIVIGQPRIRHYLDFIGFDYIKSTLVEATTSTGISIMNDSSLHNLGIHLLSRLNCKALVLSSSRGLTIFKANNMINVPFFAPREYMSAIGIRDASLALFALALASGADVVEASVLSNLITSDATIKPETMVVSINDIEKVLYRKDIVESISQIPLYK
jgi:rfaE bifunctional protein kinase chain/domain